MKITYDPQADAVYIRLKEGVHQCRTIRLSEDVAIDLTDGEAVVGIEIINASSHGLSKSPVELENLVAAVQA